MTHQDNNSNRIFNIMTTALKTFLLSCAIAAPLTLGAKAPSLKTKALDAMKSATEFMMDSVSVRGGFVWNYLPDFSRRWGEMEAKNTMVWTQAPGTPQVGHLMLDAYHATGDEFYYEQACKVAQALIWGQLECGGWNYVFDFAGENSLKDWYNTVGRSGWRLEEFRHYYGNATFDDSASSECAKFLLRMYVEKYDPAFRPALDKAINFVLESQYPVGGWPQRYPLMYDHPFEGKADYSSFITLNDDVIPECTEFLMQCCQCLGMQSLREPVLRAMYLIITLQQGQPYAGWADQYTVEDLKPAHARSYEPRAVNSGTTVAMIRQLLRYYTITADTRFLSGIPAAIEWLESEALPQSEVAKWNRPSRDPEAILVPRFIDPDSGKPLYVHREGSNTDNGDYYTDQNISNTIGHYSSAAWVNPKALRRQYEAALKLDRDSLLACSPLYAKCEVPLDPYYVSVPAGRTTEAQVKEILSAQQKNGCWLSPLGSTSNPYKAGAPTEKSHTTEFVSTNVGDEYDTSPYRCTDGTLCISTKDYLQKMSSLIDFVLNSK